MPQMSDLMFEIVAQDRTRAAFDSAGKNADSLAAKGQRAGQDTARGMDIARGSVGNLVAQFNDIGVQLAGGQSPFLIALQQGSQIGQVLGPMGAAGSVQLLKAAFFSLLSPVNLITIGAIAAGGALFTMLTSAQDEGVKAEDVLKDFDALIERIGKTSSSASDRIKEMLQQPENWSALMAGSARQVTQEQELISQEIDNAVNGMNAFITRWQDVTPALLSAQQNIRDIGTELKNGTISASEAYDQLNAMRTAETTPPSLFATLDALSDIIRTAAVAEGRLNALAGAGVLKSGRVAGPAAAADTAANFGNIVNFRDRLGVDPTQQLVDALERQRKEMTPKKSSSKMTDEERQAKAYERVTQSLEDELAMIGKSSTEQRILQQQRRANVDAASAEGQAIANLVTQIDSEKEAYAAAKEAGDFMRDALKESFSQLIPEIETGNAALDTFINKLIQASAEALFFGSGPLAGFFGGSGGIFGLFGGGRAVGGGVEPFRDYMVGENGPEIVRIGAKGGVVGPGGRGDASEARGGGSYAPVYHIDARGADAGAVARIESALKRVDQSVEKRAVSAVNQQRTRGGIYG